MRKYEQIRDTLRERINSLPVNTRLPSIRALMKKHACSLQTVKAAIRDLEHAGLIETRHGSGIYVSAQSSTKYIEFHRIKHPSRLQAIQELSIAKAFNTIGWKFCVMQHDEYFEENAHAQAPAANAYIISSDLADRKASFLKQLSQNNAPVVILGRETGTLKIDSLTGNDHQTMSLLLKHLHGLGHSKVALLVNEPTAFYETIRLKETFSQIIEVLELSEPQYIDCHTKPGDDSALSAYKGLSKYLQKKRQQLPFTALICLSANGAPGALRALYESSIKVPKQCNLLSFGLEISNQLSCPSITESGIEDDTWGEHMVKLLQQRFDNKQAQWIEMKIPATFHERESTARCTKK